MLKLYMIIVILLAAVSMLWKSNIELRESVVTYNKADKQSVKTITKIREVIKNVKEDCDCYNTAIPDGVVVLLHK